MNIRVEYTVIVWTMDNLYKQLVEYCCGFLSSSLVNYTTCIPYQISALRFTCSAAIGHWSSDCYNNSIYIVDLQTTYVHQSRVIYHQHYYNSKTLELVNKKNLILVNTRKFNRELYIKLAILYTTGSWSVLYYFSLS